MIGLLARAEQMMRIGRQVIGLAHAGSFGRAELSTD
jgi:hypothetical protein